MGRKSRQKSDEGRNRPGLADVMLLVTPLLALIPNFFVLPALSGPALATQEFVLSLWVVALVVAGLWQLRGANVRESGSGPGMGREEGVLAGALGLLIIWQMVTLRWSPDRGEGWRVIGIWVIFGVILMTGLMVVRRVGAKRTLMALTLAGVVLAATIVWERSVYGIDMLGFFFNHGIAAEVLATLLPVQLLLFVNAADRREKWLGLAGTLSGMVALLVDLRRGPLLAIAVFLLLMLAGWRLGKIEVSHPRRLLAVLVLAVVLGGAAGLWFRQQVGERLAGATRLDSAEGGLSTRLRSWMTALEMVREHPLKGVGIGGYPALYGTYRAKWVSQPAHAALAAAAGAEDYDEIRSPLTHNEYLETLAELGLIGAGLMLTVFVLIGRLLAAEVWRKRDPLATGALLGLIVFALTSVTSSFSFRVTPGPVILACLLVVGLSGREAVDDGRRVGLPRVATGLALASVVALGLLTAKQSWALLASQRLQGQVTLDTEPLDFAYYPADQSGNERLRRRYEEVIRLDPHNSGAHLGYALLLYQLREAETALPHAEYALRRGGYSRPFASVLVAFLQEQRGDLGGATETLRQCAASFPLSFFVRASLVEMLRQSGLSDEMARHRDEMYRIDERRMRSWEVILQLRKERALAEAKAGGLIPMNELDPPLAVTLAAMRGFHYLEADRNR